MAIEFFTSQCAFYDAVNFPHGFSRSGEFTKSEADILTSCGYIIKQLMSNKLTPQNDAQKRLIEVIEERVEPMSGVEKAWSKYLSKTINKKPVKRCVLSGVDVSEHVTTEGDFDD